MRTSSSFGSMAAILAGVFSILYAIFFLFISRSAPYVGILGSWVILGVSGLVAVAAYVALYLRYKEASPGYSLYALLLGAISAYVMIQHGGFEAIDLVRRGAVEGGSTASSQIDAAGLASFGVAGIVAFIWGYHILRFGMLPRNLGYVAIVNAILLVVLFLATVFGSQTLILISGGLTSVIVGPLFWIWLGLSLRRTAK